MISVIYCTRKHNEEHAKHLIKSFGGEKNIEIIEIINDGSESLTQSYNKGLTKSKNNIVVFCHDDITIETKHWGQKLTKLFEKNPEYGIIGVAGSKTMPESGTWWENPKRMYGRVLHTHDGKTWLSAYSDDLGQDLEEVVVCDGVWFAVDKTRLKKGFNENVKGFHFYDVTFCFENFIEGVKIGVTTAIKINHKSIGQTNDAWEENKKEFKENFKNYLPANVKRVVRKGEKLKVLLGCLSFANLTGSEMYIYELAKQLVKNNFDVSICSNVGHPLSNLVKPLGIKLYSLQEPPGFKLGDGKWLLSTNNGNIPSQVNVLYKMSNIDFDIIHLNHKPVCEHLVRLYPNTPIICSIHSEIISLEEPFVHPQVKKYIAIRPQIKDFLVNKFNIEENMVDIIYNPIDSNKFKQSSNNKKKDKKRIIFVGTIDYLRKQAIMDLINKTKNDNEELWLVGKLNGVELSDLNIEEHVTYFPPTNNVEELIHQCDETAGILLGRTTIEGWLCGKKGWIYDVDNQGNILSKQLHEIPLDIDKFKSENVIKEIIKEYLTILE